MRHWFAPLAAVTLIACAPRGHHDGSSDDPPPAPVNVEQSGPAAICEPGLRDDLKAYRKAYASTEDEFMDVRAQMRALRQQNLPIPPALDTRARQLASTFLPSKRNLRVRHPGDFNCFVEWEDYKYHEFKSSDLDAVIADAEMADPEP